MKHGSLFTGIGGFDLAAENVGFNNIGVAKLTRIVNLYLDKTSITMMYMVILLSFQILNMLMYSQEVSHVKIYQTLKHGVQMKNSKTMELKAREVVYGMSLQELSKKLNQNM